MDLATIIIGLVMLGIFIVPVVILSTGNKKKQNTLLNELKDFAAQEDCEISDHTTHTQFAIGISTNGEQVFFIRKQEAKEDLFKSKLSLKQVNNCELITQNRTVKLPKSTKQVIDKMEISFQNKSAKVNQPSWLLYDSEITTQLDNEYQIGTKWVSIIKKAI